MAKECESCAYESEFKSVECGSCIVSYYDGEQIGLPSNFKPKPMTNADRIRAMSDEELAVFLEEASWICDNQIFCRECPLYTGTKECKSVEEWIKQPVEVDNG